MFHEIKCFTAPSGWIHLQKQVLPLFENVCEKSTDPVIIRLAQEFDSNLLAGDFWVCILKVHQPINLQKFQVVINISL